jgi:uncharacterized phage-associated protein
MLIKKEEPIIIKISKYFISKADTEAGDEITNLKLQKLLYYAKGMYLALFNKILFEENFESWKHGPVCRYVYNNFAKNGYNTLRVDKTPVLDKELKAFLDSIWDIYGQYTAKKLEEMTHSEAPWIEARGNLCMYESSQNIIDENSMKKYFKNKYNKDEDFQDAFDAVLMRHKIDNNIEEMATDEEINRWLKF